MKDVCGVHADHCTPCRYRRLKIDDDITYPRENLVSAGGGQYMNTAVHLIIAQ